jgi:hypothetical protein
MQFQQFKNSSGLIEYQAVLYTDENGATWTVPFGHRFWDLYQDWLAQGNTPLQAV